MFFPERDSLACAFNLPFCPIILDTLLPPPRFDISSRESACVDMAMHASVYMII